MALSAFHSNEVLVAMLLFIYVRIYMCVRTRVCVPKSYELECVGHVPFRASIQ